MHLILLKLYIILYIFIFFKSCEEIKQVKKELIESSKDGDTKNEAGHSLMDTETIDLDKSNDSLVVLDKPSDFVVTKLCSEDSRKVQISETAGGITASSEDSKEKSHLSTSITSGKTKGQISKHELGKQFH